MPIYYGTTEYYNAVPYQDLVYVDSLDDLPTPINGVITLATNTAYRITTDVDLLGNRLVCASDTAILGSTSEVSSLTSSLDNGEALITSNYTLTMQNISLSVQGSGTQILDLDANGQVGAAIDWKAVNFVGGKIGSIKNYGNVIIESSAILAGTTDGFTFDGTIGTIAFDTVAFTGMTGIGTYITVPATATITRRIRIIYSAFFVASGCTGLNISGSATIPATAYFLDTVNFSGAGTYTTGVAYNDNKAMWQNVYGVPNSAAIGDMRMNANGTATVIVDTSNFVKVLGTTTANAINQKFTHTNNRLTYTGALSLNFIVSGVVSLTAGNNHVVQATIAVDGTPISGFYVGATTSASGRIENLSFHTLVQLTTNQYIEVFVKNTTAVMNITVVDMNLTIEAI